jgi:dephospho-CoA kinase
VNRRRIPRLAVTGGIGSGKSTALAYLRELGAVTISADDLVHQLLSRPEVVESIRQRFGDEIVTDGEVDRLALARLVFSDDERLAWLEGLLHPYVVAGIDAWADEQAASTQAPSLIVAEVPLLYETGFDSHFDYVMVITAPEETRRKRLTSKLTESEFGRRSRRQMSEEEKALRADFTFSNSGPRSRLKEFVRETYAFIISAGRPKAPSSARPQRGHRQA